jgi:hypothetical protein
MLALDADDYEALGWGAERALEEVAAYVVRARVVQARAWVEQHRGDSFKVKKEYVRLKTWRAQAPEKYRAIERRYAQSAKGKATKSAKNRRYYLRKKAEREQARQVRVDVVGRVPGVESGAR